MTFDSTRNFDTEPFHNEIDWKIEPTSSNATASNTVAYWDSFKQKLTDNLTVAVVGEEPFVEQKPVEKAAENDNTVKAEATSTTKSAKLAMKIFGNLDALVSNTEPLPAEGKKFASMTDHPKVAAMVTEVIQFDNPAAFKEMRAEAGRAEWMGASSIAPDAFHRVSVVRAAVDFEDAIKSGDKTKQNQALKELARLRTVKPGHDFVNIHKAIDNYLQLKVTNSPGLIENYRFDEDRRRALEIARDNFQESARQLGGFLTADSGANRQIALEAFQRNTSATPDSKLLMWSSQLGDYASSLNLKELLTSEKPDSKQISDAIAALAQTSPELGREYLQNLLRVVKEDDRAAGIKFAQIEELDIDSVRKLLSERKLEEILPQLKKALDSNTFNRLFRELGSLQNSRFSPLDLLRGGIPQPDQTKEQFEHEIEQEKYNQKGSDQKLRELERKFLRRGSTDTERAQLIGELKASKEAAALSVGDGRGPDIYQLDIVNQVFNMRNAKDPAKAADYLLILKDKSDAGNPYAESMLQKMFPTDTLRSADSAVKRLKSGTPEAETSLRELKKSTDSAEQDIDLLRIRNVTWNFKSDRVPTVKELEGFEILLQTERKNGNPGAADWLDWCQAAKLAIELPVGRQVDLKNDNRIEKIKELGELAKTGNSHARKMLSTIMIDDITSPYRTIWNAECNWADGPMALRPNLPKAIESKQREYVEAAVKALRDCLEKTGKELERSETLALCLALGKRPDSYPIATNIKEMLQNGMKGKNGNEILARTMDALRINVPGKEHLATTILNGTRLSEFAKCMPSFVAWAEAGDKVSIRILAGIAAGRADDPAMLKTARETLLELTNQKHLQQPTLEALNQAYTAETKLPTSGQPGRGYSELVELLGDVFGKVDKENVSEEIYAHTKAVFRSEFDFLKHDRDARTPEHLERSEQLTRALIASSKFMDREQLAMLRVSPELAKAMQEKSNWTISDDLKDSFRTMLFSGLGNNPPDQALACIGEASRILRPEHIATISRALNEKLPEETEAMLMHSLLRLIGDQHSDQALKDAALQAIEQRQWLSPKLDADLRQGLSDYIKGEVGDLRRLDKVIALIGDCGIEPPVALVVSRIGIPLNDESIRDVEQGLRNFNKDRKAYTKVLERALTLNAIPPDQNLLGAIDIKGLIKRMADAPLDSDSDYGFLTTNRVEDLVESLRTLHYDAMIKMSTEFGAALTRDQIQHFLYGISSMDTDSRTLGKAKINADQAIADLRQITREGHNTSYWWLAGGGILYMAKRFGPGGNEDEFAANQKEAIAKWQETRTALARTQLERDTLIKGLGRLDTAQKVQEYVQMLSKGQFASSDKIALELLTRCGSTELQRTAPFVLDQLRGKDPLAPNSKPGEIWQRLRRNHATDLAEAPVFSPGQDGFDQAIRFLQRPDLNPVDRSKLRDDSYHFMVRETHNTALHEAFRAIDQDPEMIIAAEKFGKLAGTMSTLEFLFRDGMAGYKAEDFTKLARTMVRQTASALEELKATAPGIKDLVQRLTKARDHSVDEDAKMGLDARITQLETFLKFVPGSQKGKNDESYDKLQAMCHIVDSTDFDEESIIKWLKDNGGTLILVTTALAGLALMPFSGGSSVLVTIASVAAIAATTAIVGYGLTELYKEGRYQFDGAAYGSDFLRALLSLELGCDFMQKGLRYDPATGDFKASPTVQEALSAAAKQIGKDTLINLLAAGFGKVIAVGFKGSANPAIKLAAGELTKDAAKVSASLDALIKANPAMGSLSERFAKAWLASIPWAVVGATADTIIQDELKSIEGNREMVEFFGHVSAVCLTTLFHRLGTHVMQPKLMKNGNLEIPYDQAKFLDAIKSEYAKSGKPMPEPKIEGNVASFQIGGKVIQFRFVKPADVIAAREKAGVKPEPVQPGEKLAAGPANKQILDGRENPIPPLPKADPSVHLMAGEKQYTIHPKSAPAGESSVLSYDKVTPVVLKESATISGAQTAYSRGYAIADFDGGATVIRFSEVPQELIFSPKSKYVEGPQHRTIAQDGTVSYVFDTNTNLVLKVTKGAEGAISQVLKTAKATKVGAKEINNIVPAIRTETSLLMKVDGQTFEVAPGARRIVNIGTSIKADIRLTPDLGASATVITNGNAFYVLNTGGKVELLHVDGKRMSVPTNEAIALRSGDKLIIGGKEIALCPSTNNRYSVLPLRNLETENRGGPATVDMAKTHAVAEILKGFSYCETLPGSQNVPQRIFDPVRDPVLRDFVEQARAKYGHLKGDELMKALTEYVNARMTPLVVDEGYGGQLGVHQGSGINATAERVDAASGRVMVGDLIARRSAVCLDQAMVLKYLSQELGLKTEVTTGSWIGQPHAWVTLLDGAGKRVIFDPRNYKQLPVHERGGISQSRDYSPYSKDNPRPLEPGKTLAEDNDIRRLRELEKKINDEKAPPSETEARALGQEASALRARLIGDRKPGNGTSQGTILADLLKQQPMLDANGKMAVPAPGSGPSGERTQILTFNEMVDMLKVKPRPHLKLIAVKPGSTVDGIGWDFLLIDTRTGEFRFIDAKEKPVLGYTEYHMRNTIVSNNHNGHPAQIHEIRRQFQKILDDFIDKGSPFNIVELKPPTDPASNKPMGDFLTDLELYKSSRDQVWKLWEANVKARLTALDEFQGRFPAAVRGHFIAKNTKAAVAVRDMRNHIDKHRNFLLDMQRLIKDRNYEACRARMNRD